VAGQYEQTSNGVTNKEYCAGKPHTERTVIHSSKDETETLDESQNIRENFMEFPSSGSQLGRNAEETGCGLSAFDTELRDKSMQDSQNVCKNRSKSSPINLLREGDGIRCEICERRFERHSSLALHLRAHRRHDGVRHESKEHSDSLHKFRCQKCSFVSAYAYCLARHMRNWHGACKKSVSQGRSEVSLHGSTYSVNGEQSNVKEYRKECDKGTQCNKAQRRYICEDCGFKTADLDVLSKHSCELQAVPASQTDEHKQSSASDHQTRQIESSATKDYVVQAQNVTNSVRISNSEDSHETSGSSSHMCKLCGRKFNASVNLARHARVHDRITCVTQSGRTDDGNRMELTCSVCGYEANHQNSLFRHLRDKHIAFEVRNAEGRSSFYCSKCNFMSIHRRSLLKHLRKIHAVSKTDLRDNFHSASVTNGGTFRCNKCNFKSIYVKSLKRHLRRVHGLSEIKTSCGSRPSASTASRVKSVVENEEEREHELTEAWSDDEIITELRETTDDQTVDVQNSIEEDKQTHFVSSVGEDETEREQEHIEVWSDDENVTQLCETSTDAQTVDVHIAEEREEVHLVSLEHERQSPEENGKQREYKPIEAPLDDENIIDIRDTSAVQNSKEQEQISVYSSNYNLWQHVTQEDSDLHDNSDADTPDELQLNRKAKVRAYRCSRCRFVADRRSSLLSHLRHIHGYNGRCGRLRADLISCDVELVEEDQSEPEDKSKEQFSDGANILKAYNSVADQDTVSVEKTADVLGDVQADSLYQQINTINNQNWQESVDNNSHKSSFTSPADETMLASDLIEEHAINSVNRMYKCKFCGRQFRRLAHLSMHIKAHVRECHATRRVRGRGNGKKKYRCKKCGYTSPYGHRVLRHLRRVHGCDGSELEDEGRQNAILEKKQADSSKDEPVHQQTTQTESKCADDTDADADVDVPDRLHLTRQEKETTFHCSKCSFVSTHGYSLWRHLRNIHGRSRKGRLTADLISPDIEFVDHVNQNETEDKSKEICNDATNIMDMSFAPDPTISVQMIKDISGNGRKEVLQQQTVTDVIPTLHRSVATEPYGQSSHRANKALPTSDLQQEYVNYSSAKRLYTCNLCGRQFRSLAYMSLHINAHIRHRRSAQDVSSCNDDQKKYRCKICGFSSPLGHRVLRHWRQMHQNSISEVESKRTVYQKQARRHNSEVLSERRIDSADKNPSKSEETLFPAENIDAGGDGDTSESADTPGDPRNDALENGNSQNEVPTSRKWLLSVSSPMFDLMHDASNVCRLCGKKLSRPFVLQRHIREVHLRIKPAYRPTTSTRHMFKKCPHCASLCKTEAGMLKHMKRHESGADPVYQCDECGRQFKTAGALKSHTGIHSTERSFICKTCAKAFRTIYHLRTHELQHSEEKRFCCDTCGARFSILSSFQVHQRRHTGERPFSCQDCGKAFPSSSQLKEHVIVVHTNLKPFSCPVCPLKFGLRKAMRRHVKDRHGANCLRETE